MKFNLLNRKVHYWGAVVVSVPLLVMICSGIVLQMKKHSAWVQPPERAGTAKVPEIGFDRVLEVCRGIPEMKVESWDDINRIDVRPSRGMLKVWAKSNWEAQIDSLTGEVLQVAYRRSDLIESIHDGSWFHDAAKIWVFLPTGIALLLLWVTGMYLFLLPYIVKRRRAKKGPTV